MLKYIKKYDILWTFYRIFTIKDTKYCELFIESLQSKILKVPLRRFLLRKKNLNKLYCYSKLIFITVLRYNKQINNYMLQNILLHLMPCLLGYSKYILLIPDVFTEQFYCSTVLRPLLVNRRHSPPKKFLCPYRHSLHLFPHPSHLHLSTHQRLLLPHSRCWTVHHLCHGTSSHPAQHLHQRQRSNFIHDGSECSAYRMCSQ